MLSLVTCCEKNLQIRVEGQIYRNSLLGHGDMWQDPSEAAWSLQLVLVTAMGSV
jgi:hypothetical protein